jgi:ankyrin repeat protein
MTLLHIFENWYKKPNLNTKPLPPLLIAVDLGHLELVKRFLKHGADPLFAYRNKEYYPDTIEYRHKELTYTPVTILDTAKEEGNPEIIQLLEEVVKQRENHCDNILTKQEKLGISPAF